MRLNNGEHFPTITASRVGGGEVTIPQDLAGRWAVLLFYRGQTKIHSTCKQPGLYFSPMGRLR